MDNDQIDNQKKEQRLLKKEKREEMKSEFFSELDAGRIATFITEESFEIYCETLRKQALLIKKNILMTGNDTIHFSIMIPFKFFCAIISQFKFNRETDITFR